MSRFRFSAHLSWLRCFSGCVHGGCIATTLDMVLARSVMINCGFGYVTLKLDIRYHNVIPLGSTVKWVILPQCHVKNWCLLVGLCPLSKKLRARRPSYKVVSKKTSTVILKTRQVDWTWRLWDLLGEKPKPKPTQDPNAPPPKPPKTYGDDLVYAEGSAVSY